MVQLTEDMIVARTRVTSMPMVKKLNCWGADLTDVSVIRKLHSLEVLSLSLNKLTSLSDFQHCKNLQELFVKKNQIRSLSELVWLRDLGRLRHLWLAENPCAEGNDRYRQTVIHNLPQLEKLDNVPITSEERADARFGIDLMQEQGEEEVRENIMDQYEGRRHSEDQGDERNYRGSDAEVDQYHQQPSQHVEQYHHQPSPQYQALPGYERRSSSRSLSCSRSTYMAREEDRTMYMPVEEVRSVYMPREEENLIYNMPREEEIPSYREANRESFYSVGDRDERESVCCDQSRVSRTSWGQARVVQSRAREDMVQDMARTHHLNRTPGVTRRRNRNSNMLSAILCLLKEIDIPSLEVVEMAVRCRMEEVED